MEGTLTKAAFYMLVYNTEEIYLRRAIGSILNQSERSFILFIQDNGSTGDTKDILVEYAASDSRVVLIRNEINSAPTEQEYLKRQSIFRRYTDLGIEYFAILDSDDYYDNDFLRMMYNQAKSINADIAICGTTHINESDTRIITKRIPPGISLQGEKLDEKQFIELYGLLRTVWGKLFSTRLWGWYWHLMDVERPVNMKNGIDTYIMMSLLGHVDSIITVVKPLHFYRIRKGSIYNSSVDLNRIKEGEILYLKAIEYVKTQEILNDEVITFICNVYHNHIRDLCDIIDNSKNTTLVDKAVFIRNILDQPLYRMICEKEIMFLSCVVRSLLNMSTVSNEMKRAVIISTVCKESIASYNGLKVEMISLIDQGDYKGALLKAQILFFDMMLEEDVLYFNIYILLMIGNKEVASSIGALATAYYPDSDDIKQLLQYL
jgi:glycosyltransferase involved in cell wall biosynthesis